MQEMNRRTFFILIGMISILGMALRWMGIWYVGVDFENSLMMWFNQLKEVGSLAAMTNYTGDYNLPHATIFYLLTLIPVEPIISIKMVSILFDYLEAFLAMKMVMAIVSGTKKGYFYGSWAYLLVLCNPLAVINSGYLAQSESLWVYLALLSFWYVWQDKPVRGMWALGFGIAMKLQAVFILPLLLIMYFYKKKFSILHLVWIPVSIQALCIPAILGGCSFDSAFVLFKNMLGEYPFMYYYYPNIWTFFQDAPYYQFGRAAIVITFLALLMFAVLFVQSGKKHSLEAYLEYIVWTTMTCAMLLPCMHERYNYIAEILLPVCAILNRRFWLPAVGLVLISLQCNGGSYLGWNHVSHYALAAGNLVIYFYLTWNCFFGLYKGYQTRKETESC